MLALPMWLGFLCVALVPNLHNLFPRVLPLGEELRNDLGQHRNHRAVTLLPSTRAQINPRFKRCSKRFRWRPRGFSPINIQHLIHSTPRDNRKKKERCRDSMLCFPTRKPAKTHLSLSLSLPLSSALAEKSTHHRIIQGGQGVHPT